MVDTALNNKFTLLDERKINWKFQYLRDSPEVALKRTGAKTTLEKHIVIKESFSYMRLLNVGKGQEINAFCEKMDAYCSKALIPEHDVKWIDDKDERLYKWFNAYLVKYKSKPDDIYFDANEYRKGILLFLESMTIPLPVPALLELAQIPITEDSAVIKNFHYLLDSHNEKAYLMFKEAKLLWAEVYRSGDDFSWLDKKNTNQLNWAINYMRGKQLSQIGIYINNDKDLFGGVVAMFDSWRADKYEKKCFLMLMKKAFNQKKQRDKLDGKKAYNIVMSVDIKQKLDALAKDQDRKVNQTLERIINSEYEKIFNN